jgi:hypothetical protein
VSVLQKFRDDRGNERAEVVALAIYERANSETINFENLRDQPEDDNKTMFCLADWYSINEDTWASLGDRGCMVAAAGGVNPSQWTSILAYTPSYSLGLHDGSSLSLRSKYQVDSVLFAYQAWAILGPADQVQADWERIASDVNAGLLETYDFYKTAERAMTDLSLALGRVPAPDRLFYAQSSLSDA